MDDVGQTLLNWASAFGTQEMVEFLCAKGADVNKGKNRYILSQRHFHFSQRTIFSMAFSQFQYFKPQFPYFLIPFL